MRVTDSEMKATKDNTGSYLSLALEVIAGMHQGRKTFDRVTRDNANPMAVRIGDERLSAYCHATGVIRLTQADQLHGIAMWVKLSVRPASDGFDAQNEIKAIKHISETPAGMQPLMGAPASSPPQGMPPGYPPAPPAPPAFAASLPPPAPPAYQPPAYQPPAPPPVPVAPPAPPQYKIGDFANGFQLTAAGWVPATQQPSAPAGAAQPPAAPVPPWAGQPTR
jgi:hypothetical protein